MRKPKYFVLDASVILHNPHCIQLFMDNEIAIPLHAMNIIDKLKEERSLKGENARLFIKYIDSLRERGSLNRSVQLDSGGTFHILLDYSERDNLIELKGLEENAINTVAACLTLKNKLGDRDVILVSRETTVRIVADIYGLSAEDFEGGNDEFEDRVENRASDFLIKQKMAELPSESLKDGRVRVFLSYSHLDKIIVKAVDQWLRNNGLNVIIDSRDFNIGANLQKEIVEKMSSAHAVVCFISKNSIDRKYPELERELAEHYRLEKNINVIYFCIDNIQLSAEHQMRLYIEGYAMEFNDACLHLLSGILRVPLPSIEVDLTPFQEAGLDWVKLNYCTRNQGSS